RRRGEREIQDARAYSITGFAREMLTVQDNLRRALAHLPEEIKNNDEHKAFVEGVEVTERELLNIFDRHGIKMISPKGEEYDHNLHQAMFEVETTDHPPGTVMEVIQEGYVIRDRLLRPAMVGIAKAPKAKTKNNEKTED
ncbi:MAG: nucleotide exchange factor GrpE, partial [Alphaproteobacteria bacterium]